MPVTVLLACTAAEPDATAPRRASTSELTATATSSRAPLRQRGKVLGGEKVARTVAWPDAAELATAAHARYDRVAREAIARSPVPVLAPDDPLERATVTVGAHWYALTVHGEGYSIHVDGSAQARVYPHLKTFERTHPMRSGEGFFTRNEGIWSASWIEHGAAYSFELECDRREVKWCDDEAVVLGKLEALVYLGGKQVQR